MDIKAIQALIESDMNDVNQLIHAQMRSEVALVNQLGLYIVNSGGKRVRPMLAILAAKALGYTGKDHITLATIVEFIHTATLLHDDVVDESNLRRGTPTANAEFGNAASVLVGDFIYTRSFQLMVGLGMSSISDSWYGFTQNVKTVKEYQKIVNEGEIPVFRGHILSEEDLIIRKHILNIMCHFFTSWDEAYLQVENIEIHLEKLGEMIEDGLVTIKGNNLSVPEKARPYVRNICMAFDKRLHRNKPETKLFSMTI